MKIKFMRSELQLLKKGNPRKVLSVEMTVAGLGDSRKYRRDFVQTIDIKLTENCLLMLLYMSVTLRVRQLLLQKDALTKLLFGKVFGIGSKVYRMDPF